MTRRTGQVLALALVAAALALTLGRSPLRRGAEIFAWTPEKAVARSWRSTRRPWFFLLLSLGTLGWVLGPAVAAWIVGSRPS